MKKILFVDDDHAIHNLIRVKFANADCTLCYTGGEGLEQLCHNQFDAVVLDIMMFLDGVTFVKLANGRLKNSKVYFLSCLSREEMERKIESIKDRVCGFYDKLEINKLRDEIMGDETPANES